MVQQRINPGRQFLGPWRGLNTTHDPSMLGPGWAQVARNIVLADGMIRPRSPWRAFGQTAGVDRPAGFLRAGLGATPDPALLSRIVSVIQTNSSADDHGRIVIKAVRNSGVAADEAGALYLIAENGLISQIGTKRNSNPADFVVVGEWIYVLDGGDRLVKVRTRGQGGGQSQLVGISSPPDTIASIALNGDGGINATLEYAITYFDDTTGVESNLTAIGDEISPSGVQGVTMSFSMGTTDTVTGEKITHIRIYRKNKTRGQVGFRLVKSLAIPGAGHTGDFEYVDLQQESQITESTEVTGPFAPTRNAYLTKASLGAMFNGRLYYAQRQDTKSILRFSAIGVPDHADPDDFLVARGDQNEGINGLLALGHTLYVGKEKAIWSHSGEIHTATNETNATGAVVLDNPSEQLIRTPATVGPQDQGGGNGFTLAGEPGRIYFVNKAGWYDFDGINTRVLTDLIRRTWSAFAGRTAAGQAEVITFANDPVLGILYACAGGASNDADAFILAYHYNMTRGDGIGVFTTMDAKGSPPAHHWGWTDFQNNIAKPELLESSVITAIGAAVVPASEFGFLPQPIGHSMLIVGMRDGAVAVSTPVEQVGGREHLTGKGCEFEWLSGDMPILHGHTKHVYFAKFFFGRTGRLPFGGPFTVRVGVTLDRNPTGLDDGSTRESTVVDLAQRGNETAVFPVRCEGERVTIDFGKEQWEQGHDPQLGLIGYELQTEPVGRI